MLHQARARIRSLANEADAEFMQGYFKTGPGDYAEGDRFLGIRAAPVKAAAREFEMMPLGEVVELLHSMWHEERMVALLIMARAHRRGDEGTRPALHRAYLTNTAFVNNWDLVDASAPQLVGAHLADADDLSLLERLATSESLWERRIAIVATLHFIRTGEYTPTLDVARALLGDRQDLIHKATGWMLREVGKRNQEVLEGFLREHLAALPRTMLRYAIERFPEPLRQRYLQGTV